MIIVGEIPYEYHKKNHGSDNIFDMLRTEFEVEDIDEDNILLIAWDGMDYEEYFLAILRDPEVPGNLKVVDAYHCSCYGFEGCWEPVSMPVEAVEKMRFSNFDYSGTNKQLESALEQIFSMVKNV